MEASTVITAWNRAAYVGEAVDSALAQTRRPREILVVDDGSSDDTAAIAEGYGEPVRVLRRPHEGFGPALNAGVAAATGDVVAFLDSDDLWLPNKLELQLAALEADPDLDIVYGWAEPFGCPSLSPTQRARLLPHPEPAVAPVTSGLAIRSTSLQKVGPFTADVPAVLDWLNRASEHGCRQLCLEAVLFRRRVHMHNLSRTERERLRRGYLAVVKAALDRRRHATRSPSEEPGG